MPLSANRSCLENREKIARPDWGGLVALRKMLMLRVESVMKTARGKEEMKEVQIVCPVWSQYREGEERSCGLASCMTVRASQATKLADMGVSEWLLHLETHKERREIAVKSPQDLGF